MKRVTLTFDNGPSPGVTEEVLKILASRGIRTTFFVVGKKLVRPGARELATKAHAEGHWIGNHTYTHSTPLGENPDREFARQEIEETQSLLGGLAHPDKFFRPNGGGGILGPHLFSPAALDLLKAGKYTAVTWSSVPGDWKDQDGWVDQCLSDISAQDWTTLVLHDVKNGALRRLSEALDRMQALGVEFRQDFPDNVVVTRRGELVSSLASE